MSEKRPHLNQEMAAFIDGLDKLTSEREGLEKTFPTDQWDMLVALLSFSSRITRPTRKLMEVIQGLKGKILDNPDEFQGVDKYLEHLKEIEGANKWNFRAKTNEEVA